jgi:hypothetical protein
MICLEEVFDSRHSKTNTISTTERGTKTCLIEVEFLLLVGWITPNTIRRNLKESFILKVLTDLLGIFCLMFIAGVDSSNIWHTQDSLDCIILIRDWAWDSSMDAKDIVINHSR